MIEKLWVWRGARLLDKKMPGWVGRIDVGTLNMGDNLSCVLGQLFRSYGEGLYNLGHPSAVWHGFNIDSPSYPTIDPRTQHKFSRLDTLWRKAIARRLAQVTLEQIA